ncbi:MAG: EAL domain-containing protein [Terracidiphilus sp.]
MNRRSITRTLAAMLLVCGVLRAQEYSFRNYGSAEGLNNLSIRTIYQDRMGFLWVATVNGLFRYDGEQFEVFGAAQGLPPAPGTALGDAPDGSLLAGGAFGLYRLRGNRFYQVSGPFKTVGELQGIQSDGKGHTYVNTDQGLMELSTKPGGNEIAVRKIPPLAGTTKTEYFGAPEAGGVLTDGDAVLYGCGHALCRLEKGETRVYGIKNGLPTHTVVAIRKDHEGNIWVRLRDVGVFILPVGENLFRKPEMPYQRQHMSSIPSTDSDGRVLMPMPDGMLVGNEQSWQKIDHTSGLRGVVYTAFEDRQHSLWIGLKDRGLVKWRGYREWENYTIASGLQSDEINAILPQQGGPIWVASDGGLLRGERQGVGVQWKKVSALEGTMVTVVREGPDGALWLGAGSLGVARFDVRTGKVTWLSKTQGASKGVFELCFDHRQRLWLGTNGGLYMAEAPYTKFVLISELPQSRIRAVVEGSDGTLWAGGAGGLFSFNGEHWTSHSEGKPSGQQVLSLGVGANGTIWVAYRLSNEIDRLHLGPGGLDIQKNVQRPGSNEIVYFMQPDAHGRMWVGTDHGVEVWDDGHWSHYVMSDGLIWNNCNPNGFAAEPDGTVWIGTSGGLSRFKPRPRYSLDAPIEVVFTKLEMSGADVSSLSNPTFEMHTNSLLARYSALNAPRENAVIFRYRLNGASSAWTETTQREQRFARLAPGDYRLDIEAQNGDGVWRAHRAEFGFKILMPWYRSWWFFALCGLVPFCGTGAFYRIRMAAAATREHDLQLLVEAQKTIQNLAFFDPLTELPNRRMLLDRLGKTLALSARNGRLRALLFVDLDKFKTLNDSFGHQTGDLLLKETAQRLTASIRETDTVARLGGDEFVIILEELSALPEEAASQAAMIAEKILTVTSKPYLLAGHECFLSSSIGITVFGVQRKSTEEVLQQADIAMYQAKDKGGNTARFFAPDLQTAINARAVLVEDLREAIKQGQFLLYYQPQVNRGVVTGAEALLRWEHPQRGILLPATFIPMAEETGLILPLGDWVLETACRQLATWADNKETAHLSIAVNISARQVRQADFVEKVLATLAATAANPKNLELELTESMLVENIDEVVAKMTELSLHGLKFSLDDFGTGYSSLSYLSRLPLDRLKVDRSFVRDIFADNRGRAIAQAIVSLSSAMGLGVIAEGVETEEQQRYLASVGCHLYQGYFFSWPLPIRDFEKLLAQPQSNAQPASVGSQGPENLL